MNYDPHLASYVREGLKAVAGAIKEATCYGSYLSKVVITYQNKVAHERQLIELQIENVKLSNEVLKKTLEVM